MQFARKFKFITAIFCLLLLLSVSTCFAQSDEKGSPGDKVSLSVVSEPDGATLVVDQVIRGNTPITIEVEKGVHLIRVSFDENWIPYIKRKEITRDTDLKITLSPRARVVFQKGKEAFLNRDLESAKEYLENSLNLRGKIVPEAYFYLAFIHKKQDNPEMMEKYLKKYVYLNPPHGEMVTIFPRISDKAHNYAVKLSFFYLGEIYRKRFDWDNAATAYKLAIPDRESFIDKNVEPTYENIRELRKICNKNPGDFRSLFQLGYLFELKGKLFQAMVAYRDGVKALFLQSPLFVEKMEIFSGGLKNDP